MGETIPYTYFSCPCTDISATSKLGDSTDEPESDEQEQSFNPQLLRANYALYPLEHLLYCNECHDLRCPRCYYQESLYYFCPSCLFEASSATVKNETNRCTRSCFQCPVCIAPLALNSLSNPTEQRTSADKASTLDGPFILSCPYCSWSTLEIGITFEKGVNITGQLAKVKNGGELLTSNAKSGQDPESLNSFLPSGRTKASDQFSLLADFYKGQFVETVKAGSGGLRDSFGGFDSPGSLSRLMSTYGVGGAKKQKGRLPVMREAHGQSEGLELVAEDESDIISKMRDFGWDSITSIEQRSHQPNNARFFSDVRPIATQLRSKRATRCRTCRNNLVKPDDKRQSTRYKIRLLALNYIPTMTLKAFDSSTKYDALESLKPVQFLLTLRNPLFEPVKITLATSSTTSGDIASKITILCPQFDIGANTDAWDAALDAANKDKRVTRDVRAAEGQQPEAGKVWEKGRNWTTVILEVVPGTLQKPPALPPTESESEDEPPAAADEADNLLEVPVFVRMEYEADESSIGGGGSKGGEEKRIRRELAYWCVLGVGRVSRHVQPA